MTDLEFNVALAYFYGSGFGRCVSVAVILFSKRPCFGF